MNDSFTRRQFLATGAVGAAGLAALSTAAVSTAAQAAEAGQAIIGPLVGHTDTASTMLWAWFPKPGRYELTVRRFDGAGEPRTFSAEATTESDQTAKWTVDGLAPNTQYRAVLPGGRLCAFKTPPADDQPAKVTLGLGSCATEDAGSRAVWTRMVAENVDAVVLGGDTPYIDSGDRARQRARHRAFAGVAEFQALVATRPFWSTWDDHDFGVNDCDGTFPDKENSRNTFMEYRAQPTYGDGTEGIYTSFRWGPIEVFMIDARWWSWTAPSFADPSKKTLLGEVQWKWLQEKLAASTAAFKLLVCGVIWEDKGNREKDDWETYVHERDALFNFIKEKHIPGCLLFGGDIHCTRLLKYPPEHVGYPLYEFISSPIHHSTIPGLNKPHPYLVESKVAPNTFMTITVDATATPPTLKARFLDVFGNSLFEDLTVTRDDLTPA